VTVKSGSVRGVVVANLTLAIAVAVAAAAETGLFDYDAGAPLDVQEAQTLDRGGVTIHDITYASPKGGRVTAFLVTPEGKGPFAGIVFLHWGQGNRSSFLPEAISLARSGAESILIDAPFIRPAPWRVGGGDFEHPEPDRDSYIQTVVDLRRAVDLLLASPGIDAKRIGYVGHSFGATWGGVLAGVEKRISAYVLMAGLPRLSADLRATRHPILAESIKGLPGEVLDRYTAVTEPLDAIHFVGGSSPAPILFQFARFDMFISEEQAHEYEAAAGSPKTTKWYDSGHELNAPEALRDRDDWLSQQLRLGTMGQAAAVSPGAAGGAAVPEADRFSKEVVYRIPGMDQALIRKDRSYGKSEGFPLKMDLYQPASFKTGDRTPAVVLIHGDAPNEVLRNAKEWGVFTSYGRLIAASGMAAVTFNHRSAEGGMKIHDAAADVDALLKYVRGHAADLGVDADRICIWVFSAGGPYGLRAAMEGPPPFVRCIVSYYALMDLQRLRDRIPRQVLDDTLKVFSPIEYLKLYAKRLPPMLVMKADLDTPAINGAIDRFVVEARAQGAGVELLIHPAGRHAFDTLDDDPKSAAIIRETLEFVAKNLGVATPSRR